VLPANGLHIVYLPGASLFFPLSYLFHKTLVFLTIDPWISAFRVQAVKRPARSPTLSFLFRGFLDVIFAPRRSIVLSRVSRWLEIPFSSLFLQDRLAAAAGASVVGKRIPKGLPFPFSRPATGVRRGAVRASYSQSPGCLHQTFGLLSFLV